MATMWDEQLYKAASTGNIELFKTAVGRGARIDWENIAHNGNRPIHAAALGGHAEILVWLLGNGVSVGTPNRYFLNTPLHYAASKGRATCVMCLLDYGADFNCQDNHYNTPLMWASQIENLDSAFHLLKAGADPTLINDQGETALHFAAQEGHTELVSALIRLGADVNAADKNSGYMPMHYAAASGHGSVVSTLIKGGGQKDATSLQGNTALHRAAWNGRTDTVELLIKEGCNINIQDKRGDTPLHDASRMGHYNTVTSLLIAGADFRLKNFDPQKPATAKDIARKRKHNKVLESFHQHAQIKSGLWSKKMKFLRSNSKHMKVNWTKVFLKALEDGDFPLVKQMVANKVDVNQHVVSHFSWTPLHYAVAYGHFEITKFLVEEHEADIDAIDDEGEHVLHLASLSGHYEIVRWLVQEKGIDPNVLTKEKFSPCHRAAKMGRLEMISFLLSYGADLSIKTESAFKMSKREWDAMMKHFSKAKQEELKDDFIPLDDFGDSVLHIAVREKFLTLAQRLVQWGADVNAKNHKGNTPLHEAVFCGNPSLVLRLLGMGADPYIYNRQGKTPHFCAHELHFYECAVTIENAQYVVDNVIRRKNMDSFFMALKVAGLESLYGILALEVDCHDMRHLTDRVLMGMDKLKNMGFRPVEIRRVQRMTLQESLGRSTEQALYDANLTAIYSVLSLHGYIFTSDLVQIDKEIYSQLELGAQQTLRQLSVDLHKEFHEMREAKKQDIQAFWRTAQVDNHVLGDLGAASQYAIQTANEEAENFYKPVPPSKPRPLDAESTDGAGSPRQKRIQQLSNTPRFLGGSKLDVKDMIHFHPHKKP